MIKNSFTACFISVLFINCKPKAATHFQKYEREFNRSEYMTKDGKCFTLEIPKSWREIEVKAIDSDVMVFVNSLNDTITSDYGRYSNSLNEELPTVFTKNDYNKLSDQEKNKLKKDDFLVIENYDNYNPNNLYKSTSAIYKIDHKNAKVVVPKISGKGITGVYFDKLSAGENNAMKLNMYGQNVNKITETEILNAVSTIKFKY